MWTPRRVLLLLGGILFFVGVYVGYAHLLGWLDGLPQLPAPMLREADGVFRPPVRTISPTVQRLLDAFGPDCPEQQSAYYPTQLEFRNGDSSVVLAAGPTPLSPNSHRVTLAPFSLAVFGKPKPAHLLPPGEVVEISTFHADKAVLEFDRVINTPNDMNKAKLLRLELVSEPEQALPDPRRGIVHITHNQRSADPNQYLLLCTPGPVFYRDPKGVDRKANPGAADGPDIWTDAAVEIIDRQNIPRPYGAPKRALPAGGGKNPRDPETAPASGEDLRDPAAVPEILAGKRLPPPTVTAVGMRIYLEPEPKAQPNGQPAPKKEAGPLSGVRRIELLEKVLFNLWIDSRQGMVSTPKAAAEPRGGSNPLAVPEPPAAAAAVVGAVFFAVETAKRLDRALLQIDTLGPFSFDNEKNLARFDVIPQANPNLPNDVQMSRILPTGRKQQLFTQILEIEFNGAPTGPQPATPTPKAPSGGGTTFKRLNAWTTIPGQYITIHAEDERLEAYGQKLVHEQAKNETTLTGARLYVVRGNEPRKDRGPAGANILTAGSPQRAALLILKPGPDGTSTTTVEGPGRIEMFDPASNGNTIHATWQTSLVHAIEVVNQRDLDAFTFTDGASFEDKTADYWLRGRVLKLWLEPGEKQSEAKPAEKNSPEPAGQFRPNRLQAISETGEVRSHSTDFDIESAYHLNVVFRDGIPPPLPPKPAAPMAPAAAAPGTGKPLIPPVGPPAPEPPKEPQKPKPPMKLKARVIDTWVVRYPTKPEEPKPEEPKAGAKPERPGEGGVRYEIEKARCEDHVVVHQDPADPDKPRGVDILGQTLLVDHTPDGSVMTVTGPDQAPGQVHHEGMSIVGPKIVIDQLHNLTVVEGRGALSMPAGSDLSGGELKQPEVLNVHWRDGMTFSGAKKTADFLGKVTAEQGESWVQCHRMVVILDRPVSFNQFRKSGDPPAPKKAGPVPPVTPMNPAAPKPAESDSPKVEIVRCYPADDDAREDRDSATVRFHQTERDPKTRAILKTQFLNAKELEMSAQAQDDDGRGEKYQRVIATGPGVVRIWQPGQKDLAAGPQPMANATKPNANKPASNPAKANPEDDTEMKLTVVTFHTRMTVKDKAKIYQEAVFLDNVEAINVPADRPNLAVDRHRLPPGSMRLNCADRLIVASHKQGDNPATQSMRADGNAYIRSDEYDGWGETITYDGKLVTLYGGKNILARIQSRFKNDGASGKVIVYDRLKNGYESQGSFDTTIQPAAKPTPPPKKP